MTMVERVARALCERDYPDLDWGYITESFRDEYRAVARTAIEAMREPTEGMVEAYSQACERVGFRLYITAKDALGPMITAALSEGDQLVRASDF